MKLLLLTPSPCSNKNCADLVAYYLKLTGVLLSMEMQHFGAEKVSQPQSEFIDKALKKEALKIDKLIKPNDGVILMSEHGTCYPTLKLQTHFESWLQRWPRLCIVFGSAYGLHSSLYLPERLTLSLSPMTMQHELALVVWMEQLYRLMTLKTGKRYHY